MTSLIGGAVITHTASLARRRSVISSSVRSSAGPRRSVAHVHFGEHLFEALRLRCHPVSHRTSSWIWTVLLNICSAATLSAVGPVQG